MRVGLLTIALVLGLLSACARSVPDASSAARFTARTNGSVTPTALVTNAETATKAHLIAEKVDFARQVKPILEARCQPCHFSGGTMYQRLPFDQPKTIITLGTKLFTRIKDEQEQHLIREFLAQQSAP